jgi:CRISPR/Cas system CSM-associated protein Csm3 (group 7 of RAMP superfamily)
VPAVELQVTVQIETPLNIGSGALADALADKPLVRDAQGCPLIPGSALKGKVRHECERIARALISPWLWACEPPLADKMCRDNPCPICRVFGAPWHPSPLTFDDLVLNLHKELKAPSDWGRLRTVQAVALRPGVGISRTRGVAEDQLFFSLETYQPPSALFFQGLIWGTVAEKGEVSLVLAGLRAVKTLGGARSRGLGWCRFETAVSWEGKPQDDQAMRQELSAWLSSM